MKITVYTISDCQFSKKEKEYLTAHNLAYEEKNLETNKEFLTEMLAVSNNFAGTPVTKIEKDDGKIEVLKGFTPEEFDEVLGLSKPQTDQSASNQTTAPQAPPPPSPAPTTQPITDLQSQTTPPAEASASAMAGGQPPTENQEPRTNNQSDPLDSILADLQAKAVDQQPTPDNQPPGANPQYPTTNSSNSIPSIPDFLGDKTS